MACTDTRCYNVKDYGAYGDGSNDDSGAVQDAFDDANATTDGATVYFPSGVYLLFGDTGSQGNANYTIGARVNVFGPTATIQSRQTSGDLFQFTHDYGNMHLNGIVGGASSGSGNGVTFKGAQYCRAVVNIIQWFRGANAIFRSVGASRNTHDNILHVGQMIGHDASGGNLLFESKQQDSDATVEGNTVYGGLVLKGYDYCCHFGNNDLKDTARYNKIYGALHSRGAGHPALRIYNSNNCFIGDFFYEPPESSTPTFVYFIAGNDTLIVSDNLGEGQYGNLGTKRATIVSQGLIQRHQFAITRESGIEVVRDRSRTDSWWAAFDTVNGGVEFLGGANLPAAASFKSSRDIEAPNIGRQTVDGWIRDNIPTSLTAAEMTRPQGRWRAIRPGSVTGLLLELTATQARTAGTATAEVWKATVNPSTGARTETATGLTAVLDGTNPCFAATTQAKDTDAFGVGDELFVKLASASWAPTTADARVSIEIET